MEAAFRRLIDRHETLRTGFEMVKAKWFSGYTRRWILLSGIMQAKREEEADEHRARPSSARLILAKPPLLRVGLIELEPNLHMLLFDMHHIISDGVSMAISGGGVPRLYTGEELPPLRIQYKDYAVWQQSEAQQERMRRQEAYWLKRSAASCRCWSCRRTMHVLRCEVRRRHAILQMDARLSEGLQAVAAENGARCSWCCWRHIRCCCPSIRARRISSSAPRWREERMRMLEPVIGMFVNTLAIRNCPAGEKSFLSYLEEVKETILGAYEHQDYPFEEMVGN